MRKTIIAPYEVTDVLKSLGSNLRKARLRRNLTIDEVANRVGVHRETLSQAEQGSANVSIGTYLTAMWVYGLADQVRHVCAPENDKEGTALDESRARVRAHRGMDGLSNAF